MREGAGKGRAGHRYPVTFGSSQAAPKAARMARPTSHTTQWCSRRMACSYLAAAGVQIVVLLFG